MTFKNISSADEFAKNYPFVPYQFQLLQKVFEAIRKVGASGMHLARGERSMLDAFQSAAKTVSKGEIGVLVPLYEFYPSIESFLDTSVKKTIDQAEANPTLEPADISLLQVLFLIRYVEEMKGNVDNLVTLSLDQIDGDRLALRRKIEASLARLEKETLIGRSGENYFFLTNEERDINKEIKAVELSSGEEAKLLGEVIFDEVLKGQRKHRFSTNKVDFEFNRRCDDHPVGNQKEGALLFLVVTPLADDYETYNNARCILDSTVDGGIVLVRLGNDEALGRELRIYVQTAKYLSRKNDGTLSGSLQRILRDCAEDNRIRRERLAELLTVLLTGADYFATSQPLKLKSSNPEALLAEAMEYLIQNTFNKMSYLERLTPETERLKELQAILRSNDIAKEKLLFEEGQTNLAAIEDLRVYLELSARQSRQVVLHDMIEKRYALRPYGWPDEEVLLIVARMLVQGEINLMMDGAPVPLDKAYESLTAQAKRRKVVLVKRQTAAPEAIRNARNLGKELFAEMGPDGGDALFVCLQGKLKDWQASLSAYKPMADTGNYPGGEAIDEGLTLINRLLADKESLKFIERFNLLRKDLLDFSERHHELEHFYAHQRTIWENLRKANARFRPNHLELERDAEASPALARIQTILTAASPYGSIKDVEGLIRIVDRVNSTLLTNRRKEAVQRIDGHHSRLAQDIAAMSGGASLRDACLKPLESLRQRVEKEESVAHITQAETEAMLEFDAGIARIEEFSSKQAETSILPVVKKQRVVKAADLMKATYLETPDEVNAFLKVLRIELERALANNERVQIR